MKVKLDENASRSLVDLLAAPGHDADTTTDEGLSGADDDTLFAAARSSGRLLVTLDRGFADLRRYPPGTHSGIVVLRPADQSVRAVNALVRRMLAERDLDALAGAITIVEPGRVRIRRTVTSER